MDERILAMTYRTGIELVASERPGELPVFDAIWDAFEGYVRDLTVFPSAGVVLKSLSGMLPADLGLAAEAETSGFLTPWVLAAALDTVLHFVAEQASPSVEELRRSVLSRMSSEIRARPDACALADGLARILSKDFERQRKYGEHRKMEEGCVVLETGKTPRLIDCEGARARIDGCDKGAYDIMVDDPRGRVWVGGALTRVGRIPRRLLVCSLFKDGDTLRYSEITRELWYAEYTDAYEHGVHSARNRLNKIDNVFGSVLSTEDVRGMELYRATATQKGVRYLAVFEGDSYSLRLSGLRSGM